MSDEPKPKPVRIAVAKAIMQEHWAGLRGYPALEEGRLLLARGLQDSSLSVEHARSVAATFNHQCPTPKEIADVAFNLRDRFQPNLSKKWVEEGATYDPHWSEKLLGDPNSGFRQKVGDVHVQAIKDMLYYTEGPGRNESHDRRFWADARFRDLKDYPALVAAVRAGRTPTVEEMQPIWKQKKVRAAGVASPIDAPPITEADVEAAKLRYEEEKKRLRTETAAAQTAQEIAGLLEGIDDGYREPEEEE